MTADFRTSPGSGVEKREDDLVEHGTQTLVNADHRLLDAQMWLDQPAVIHRLISEAAVGESGQGLTTVAAAYLATARGSFQLNSAPPEDVDHFVVLGKSLNADTTPKPELIARLKCALMGNRANPTARLLVSGGGQTLGVNESDVMKNWLTERGVDPRRILVESQSRDTVENIIFSTAILTRQKAKRVCLITGTQSVRRGTGLLRCHLNQINSKMETSSLAAELADTDSQADQKQATERFLLFKDLGRILEIWNYRCGFSQST